MEDEDYLIINMEVMNISRLFLKILTMTGFNFKVFSDKIQNLKIEAMKRYCLLGTKRNMLQDGAA
jgi:hypothetical protein